MPNEYFIKAFCLSTIFYGYYCLFLKNKTHHPFNRFFLLAVIPVSIFLPLIHIRLMAATSISDSPVLQILNAVNNTTPYVDDLQITNMQNGFDISIIFMAIYFIISGCLLIKFIRTLMEIHSIKKNSARIVYKNANVFLTTHATAPFSYFDEIFWNARIPLESETGNKIFQHELAHIVQKHTLDKLFLNIVLILFWWNPIFWLIRKELHMVHEFIADKNVIENGDTASFAQLILQSAFTRTPINITNSFYQSPLKRRLMMLTKTNNLNVISRIVVLPLAIILFAAFSFKQQRSPITVPVKNKITVVIDPGHGGTDAGAINGNISEKDITLMLAKKIKEMNSNENIQLVLSREMDVYASPKEKAGFSNKVHADLFISVHLQFYNNEGKKTGMETFISRDEYGNSKQSKIFASAIINTFNNNYHLPVFPNPQQRKTGIMVLQATNCPAVLIEAGYINNDKDRQYLLSDEGQHQFAENILNAIALYAKQQQVN